MCLAGQNESEGEKKNVDNLSRASRDCALSISRERPPPHRRPISLSELARSLGGFVQQPPLVWIGRETRGKRHNAFGKNTRAKTSLYVQLRAKNMISLSKKKKKKLEGSSRGRFDD